MALIKCPDCGKKVSTSATACPKCGHVITDTEKLVAMQRPKPGKAKIVIGALIAAIFLSALLGKKPQEESAQTQPPTTLPRECEGMTPEKWAAKDTYWRSTHPECLPQGSITYTYTRQSMEDYLKKSLPSYQKYGGYRLKIVTWDANSCEVELAVGSLKSPDDARRIARNAVHFIRNFYALNGGGDIIRRMTATAYDRATGMFRDHMAAYSWEKETILWGPKR